MKILSVDSTAGTSTVAVSEDKTLLGLYSVNITNTHSETLLPMIKSILNSLKLSIRDIDAFAVSNGPGSFTGVRIGVATIKGLAFGTGKPCVGVSTIEALANNLEGFDGIICPVMNARRGQVYTGIFENGKAILGDTCITVDELVAVLEKYDKNIYFCGDGYNLLKERELKNFISTPEVLIYQNAFSVAKAAYDKIAKGDYSSDRELNINYLRKPQAEREREEKIKKEDINNE